MSQAPGPKGHPLHGSWPEFREDPLAFLRNGRLAHGDFFRFRLGLTQCFALSDPAAIQAVFTDHEGFTDKTPPHRMQDAYPDRARFLSAIIAGGARRRTDPGSGHGGRDAPGPGPADKADAGPDLLSYREPQWRALDRP